MNHKHNIPDYALENMLKKIVGKMYSILN